MCLKLCELLLWLLGMGGCFDAAVVTMLAALPQLLRSLHLSSPHGCVPLVMEKPELSLSWRQCVPCAVPEGFSCCPAAALPWLRDPFAPDDPLRELMAGRLMAQLEREAAALAVMASLAVVVVHLPVKLAAPQLYPLRFPAGEDCCLCICGLLLTQLPCCAMHR